MVVQSAMKLRGLFINPAKANCSIYESGRMIYNCLCLSDKYDLDYQEVEENNRSVLNTYDFYAFNYHYVTMGWLDTSFVRKLPGLKLTFVLEASPNDPFVLCSSDDFDLYCVLDPSMNIADKRVYAFPRPLEVPKKVTPYREQPVPVIGSFGFATPGKGFELVVDAVNEEFDEAIVRINIPKGTYADDVCWKLHKQNYADYLTDLCKKSAKKGVQVTVTRDFMSKDELIEWCGQNTLNCFLYNRNQPGLSATTDQAISSGRPLAVSTNETFRHITTYVKPYPYRSLKESLISSQSEVIQMQKDWAPERFAEKFEAVLLDFKLTNRMKNEKFSGGLVELKKIPKYVFLLKQMDSFLMRIKAKLGLPRKVPDISSVSYWRPKTISFNHKRQILIVSHKEKQCGIHQYGINIFEALKKSTKYAFTYTECSCPEDLRKALVETEPDAIIYNYYHFTMPWLTSIVTKQYSIPQLGIMHEVTQEEADNATCELFDYHLCPDPTIVESSPIIIKTKRLIPPYINMQELPKITTIGSFGFGFGDKGFDRIIEAVQSEFDRAKIIFQLPFNDVVDREGQNHTIATIKGLRRLVRKSGIKLVINHEFLTKQQLLNFLASNTLNAFFYETEKHRGISSTIEHALAVQRPVAITKCGMFRHILSATPSICIEDSSLKEIIDNGIAPLIPFCNAWSEAAFIDNYEQIFDKVFRKENERSNSSAGENL